MKPATLLILMLLSFQFLLSQTRVTGKVVDALNKQPLPDATITLFNAADSAAAGFAVADKTGLFEIRNVAKGTILMNISFTGYSSIQRRLEINPANLVIELDTIFMQLDTNMMAGVVVTAPPITVKKDTVEFRASSFKTKPNATVEDLLKKLPGVEVDKDGAITAQGEEITKIYVDGKEFFGNDPKLATKNLPTDMIESIQVYDDMSDQAKFTKIDDGSRKRTINIKLKKDRKKGLFLRSTAAMGTEGRYDASASAHTFNNNRQLSFIGGANNVNKLGFSSNDLMNLGNRQRGRGGRGGGVGGVNGNLNTWSTGVNFKNEWGKKVEFAGSYFVSHTNNSNVTESYRQSNFGNDSVALTTRKDRSRNISTNHNFGFRLEYEIDSMNSILVQPSVSLSQAESFGENTNVTFASSPNFTRYKAIEGSTNSSNDRTASSIGNNLLFRHRFNKPGRTFTIGWTTGSNNNDGFGTNKSPYRFFAPNDSTLREDNRDQHNFTKSKSFNNTVSSSITEMLGYNNVLELNYAYSVNRSISDRDTYEYSAITKDWDSVNKPLTNYFENTFTSSRLGGNFRVQRQKYDWQVGGAVNMASLDNLSNRATTNKDSIMTQHYTNFFPNASFNYNPKPRTSLRFNYRGSTRAPSISQLQDVADLSNPLNVRTGNPNLQQEFTHNVNLSYNAFNLSNFVYMNMSVGASVVSNKIVNSISQVSPGVLLTKPENLDGAHNLNFSGTLGLPLVRAASGRKSPLNLSLTSSAGLNRDVSLLRDTLNYSYTNRLGQRIRISYFQQDKLDVTANVSFNYNDARYSMQENRNFKYFDHQYSLDLTYTMFKRLMINNDFDYYVNTGREEGFNQSIPIWNASVSCLLFKKSNGELKLSGIDLLNQNKSINRSVSDFYIEDTYTQVLQRFFMLSFMYNFNSFNGKSMNSSRRS